MAWPFEQIPKLVTGLAALGMILFFYLMRSKKHGFPLVLDLAFFTVIGVNLFLSAAFYPNVLKYQLGNDAAAFIEEQKLPKDNIQLYGIHEGRALHFYAKHIFQRKDSLSAFPLNGLMITDKDSLPAVKKVFPDAKVLREGNHFGVTALSLPFLNPDTREGELPKYLILDLDGNAVIH